MPDLEGVDIAQCFLHRPGRDTCVWIKKQVAPMRYFAKVLHTLLKGHPISNDLGGSDSKQTSKQLEVLLPP